MKGHTQIGDFDSTVTVLDKNKNSPRGIAKMRDNNPADKSRNALYRQAEDLLKIVEQESIVDSDKVRLIKAAIADGTYRVNPSKVADKLMEMETELTRSDGDDPTAE